MITRRKFIGGAALIPSVLMAGPVGLPFFVKSTCPSNPKTAAWITGGMSGTPSTNTINAANCFANEVDTSGVVAWSDLIALNFFPPDGLVDVGRYPYIVGPGSRNPWNISLFVDADLTVNGLKGDGANKYILTGISGTDFSSATSAGVMLYIYTMNTVVDGVDCGAFSAGNDCLLRGKNGSGNSDWDSFNTTVGAGRISAASPGAGFFSGQRIAANDTKLYYATSTSPHAAIASAATSGGTTATGELYMLAINSAGPAFFSDSTISVCAITNGLSASKSAEWFRLFHELRQRFGGGFI